VAYYLSFFCRAGEDTGQAALERLLDELLANGAPLLREWRGPYVDAVAAYSLATRGSSGEPAADWLTLEIHVGVRFIAESVIAASPNDEQGIWGSDLLATVTLSGDSPDWPLVDRIWTALVDLWSAVPWDETSGFEIGTMNPVSRG
jgi:hypothetical protein